MKNYYTSVKSHTSNSVWEKVLGAKTLQGAKAIASQTHGDGFIGDLISVVQATNDDFRSGMINDLPEWSRVIGSKNWNKGD